MYTYIVVSPLKVTVFAIEFLCFSKCRCVFVLTSVFDVIFIY